MPLPIKPPHLPFLIFQTGLTLQCKPALIGILLALASQVLGLQVEVTMPSYYTQLIITFC